MAKVGHIQPYKDGWRIFVQRNGSKRTEVFRGTRRDAEIRAAEMAAEMGQRDPYPSMTLGEYWREVFPHRLSNRGTPRAATTMDGYAREMERSILPKLGNDVLKEITHEQMAAVIRSSSAPSNTKRVLKVVMRSAYDDGLMPQKPLERRVQVERKRKPKYPPWTAQEASQALSRMDDGHLMAYLVLGLSGLRMEEALGASWSDLSEGCSTVSVHRTYTDVGGLLEAVKNSHSKRTVPVIPQGRAVLEGLMASLPVDRTLPLAEMPGEVERARAERIVPMRGDVLLAKWRRACARLGLRYIPPSNLRHTSDTLYLAAGVRGELNDKLHGRANPTVTYGSYYRPAMEQMEDAAQALGRLLDVES